jgi:hypothetical protein
MLWRAGHITQCYTGRAPPDAIELLRVPVMFPGSLGAWKALTVIAFGVLAGLGMLFDLRYTISVLLPPLLPPLLRPLDPPAQACDASCARQAARKHQRHGRRHMVACGRVRTANHDVAHLALQAQPLPQHGGDAQPHGNGQPPACMCRAKSSHLTRLCMSLCKLDDDGGKRRTASNAHQAKLRLKPLMDTQMILWTKYSVTAKSRHFFARSTCVTSMLLLGHAAAILLASIQAHVLLPAKAVCQHQLVRTTTIKYMAAAKALNVCAMTTIHPEKVLKLNHRQSNKWCNVRCATYGPA